MPTAPKLPTQSAPGQSASSIDARLQALLPTDVLLLGEQHDAAEHQALQRQVVARLVELGALAGVALEMASAGNSTTGLSRQASQVQVREALQWNDEAWPWAAYGPTVMLAVQAGIPVLGANLPASRLRASMAERQLDVQLPGPALKAQQQLIRAGHCNLLPESQITPMTRVQIARDISMAQTLAAARQQAGAGQLVLLISGSVHADKRLGVPQHLARGIRAASVRLRAGTDEASGEAFDTVWSTPALPETDYCAGLRQQLAPGKASGEASTAK
jgi:uncharacterized iron-regulated protein